ncbi:hypothetical protein ANANG_G00091190 [Anguilla anguilla]|uniref:DNA-binding protein RFX2 n=1 Tax=Anguilla anguilla TaxID=7936 RepID=A0A9D3S3Z3_ANGAN|nr:hypothetical protein ANANG_G00091190 [Anguilla anguilla]
MSPQSLLFLSALRKVPEFPTATRARLCLLGSGRGSSCPVWHGESSMQSSEGGSDSSSSVALRTSSSSQAPVVQPVPASQQRVLVQATGSGQKGAQVQQLSRVQQVPQQVQQVQHVYPSQVQYVEGGEVVYTNGTMRGAPRSPRWCRRPAGVPPRHGGVAMDVGGSQIISSGGTYLIHGGGMDGGRHLGSHSARSSSAMLEMAIENLQKSEGITTHKSSLLNSHLQWLLDNYETADGVSLPRSSLYNHYLWHCQEQKLDPVNAASFGKLIRSVFMGLRTRRLGNRFKPLQKVDGMGDSFSGGSQHSSGTPDLAAQSQHHQQYIDVSHVLPPFPSPDLGSCPLPERISPNDVKKLQSLYRDHCEATLDVVMNLQFHYIEKLWQTFWYSTAPSSDGATPLPNSEEETEGVIPREKLVSLCKYEPVRLWMRSCDHILYQALVEILIPDVLRPVPSTLTQAIRNFAKSLEGWLTSAMRDFPQEIVPRGHRGMGRAAVVSAFAQTLRRYTSLNHLAQAARAVLQNTSQINQMLSDLNRVDFANVQEQASWVCQCDEAVVQRLEQDFKFLLKWSFYSSMVIRDLTLRSAASFGSFHLIRLLYDEYMFYLVEHRVAQATGETPIAVMGEFSDLNSMMPMLMEKDSSFSDDMSDLGSDGDMSRGPSELAVKREPTSLQEI